MKYLLMIAAVLAAVVSVAQAQAVFAHVIMGNNGAYTASNWESDIALAASKGIDAFVLNICPPLAGTVDTQSQLAFAAAQKLNFKLLFSFDYLGGPSPWATNDIINLLDQYKSNSAYFKYENKPFVSTFEGPTNSDVDQWSQIRSSISGGIYFVPAWTSQGPGYRLDLVDGSFSWDMWPNGPNNMTTSEDEAYISALGSKSYMMGVSPWFYTNLPAYNKAWVWRGDSLWHDRWAQIAATKPAFVQIVSWNDFGESHYVGPIYNAGIPSSSGADAQTYVENMPHTPWLETLPSQIAAYKGSSAAAEDKVVYWYRLSPASAGSTDATGNAAKSSINTGGYQTAYPVSEVLEDGVFAIAILSKPGSVTIQIGTGHAQTFGGLKAGINFVSRPFCGQTGRVRVTTSTGVRGSGVAIQGSPAGGTSNFNAWVGCAGSCSQKSSSGGGWSRR